MSFRVQFDTNGPEFDDFGDGDAAADVLRDTARRLSAGIPNGPVTNSLGAVIGRYGFESDDSAELVELRERVKWTLLHLATSETKHAQETAAILRGQADGQATVTTLREQRQALGPAGRGPRE